MLKMLRLTTPTVTGCILEELFENTGEGCVAPLYGPVMCHLALGHVIPGNTRDLLLAQQLIPLCSLAGQRRIRWRGWPLEGRAAEAALLRGCPYEVSVGKCDVLQLRTVERLVRRLLRAQLLGPLRLLLSRRSLGTPISAFRFNIDSNHEGRTLASNQIAESSPPARGAAAEWFQGCKHVEQGAPCWVPGPPVAVQPAH